MAIFNRKYILENKVKYNDKLYDRAYNIFNKIQNILKNSNSYLFTLYPVRKDNISVQKKNEDLICSYNIGKASGSKEYKDDINKIITNARYVINDETKDCKVNMYWQIDKEIYVNIKFFDCADKYVK